MSNHFHLVVETPEANLVEGMRWLQSTYTIRLNHRHKLFGHVFSGRYKALLVDGSGNGYLKTVCDYVHLNPARAGLLKPEEPLPSYPWSSLPSYSAAPGHPAWLRADRLFAEHGFREDTPQARREFQAALETRRAAEAAEDNFQEVRRGWCLGSPEFRQELLARFGESETEQHTGDLARENNQARAERIIAEHLAASGWNSADSNRRPKSDPAKLALAARLRRETTLTVKQIADLLSLGTPKSATTALQKTCQTIALAAFLAIGVFFPARMRALAHFEVPRWRRSAICLMIRVVLEWRGEFGGIAIEAQGEVGLGPAQAAHFCGDDALIREGALAAGGNTAIPQFVPSVGDAMTQPCQGWSSCYFEDPGWLVPRDPGLWDAIPLG